MHCLQICSFSQPVFYDRCRKDCSPHTHLLSLVGGGWLTDVLSFLLPSTAFSEEPELNCSVNTKYCSMGTRGYSSARSESSDDRLCL